ncbi:heterodisulfide reductase-related iron-sulfur binding cluster [Cellulomonas gelida]
MPRSGADAFCCGAGGARVWMEESIGTRISTARATEAIATGADVIATACPYCTVMLTDGVAAAHSTAETAPSSSSAEIGVPEVTDIAVLLRARLSTTP